MSDHVGYMNTSILCGTCGHMMDLGEHNRPNYEPGGEPIVWGVVCRNAKCPHFGVAYKVEAEIKLTRI